MKITLNIQKFDRNNGIKCHWENGFEIDVKNADGVIILLANKEGLVSLANHLLNLAQEEVPVGYHLHFDENNSLEEGSLELIIEKKQ